ncbi:HAD-IIIC family phosphatase [Nevskia soli]|uniref:HAD-IIIC family phosphatase n=1 Tax=Nevskia soli TaxID=418856 RepID=UPI0015D8A9F9|nr:HAD-IIIC family phosphatase [Nevskia soli]
MQKNTKLPLESHLGRELKGQSKREQLATARTYLETLGAALSPDGMELLRSVLGRGLSGSDRDHMEGWLAELPPTRNAARLHALLATDLGLPRAAPAWRGYLDGEAVREPADLLAYARVLADAGEWSEAARQLRLALSSPMPYTLFARSEKLVARVAAQDRTSLRTARIAILGNATTAFFAQVLRSLCFRDRIAVEIYEGAYGSQQQEILDPESGLAKFHPSLVILPLSWRDLRLSGNEETPRAVEANLLAERYQTWKQIAERFSCHVIQYASDYPATESFGYLGNKLDGGRRRVIEVLNRGLWDNAPGFVSIVDAPELQRALGAAWEDAAQWAQYQQHPATSALPELAESVAAHIRAVVGLTRKVLVTDLDNTLWNGVIGEDGVGRIEVGPGTPAGEAHLQLQVYLKELRERGVLLAVSSKNNPEDARLPFQEHAGMALKLEDFAAFRANWEDKAENIRRIAEELSLGLDSFVFIDDNPLEREWVRSQLPDVAVVELGSSVFQWVREIDRGRYFLALTLSAEDLARATQYQQQSARETLRSAYGSMDEFLQQLQLEASVEPVSSANLARATQLINKTNQFNLTTRRYTEAQIAKWMYDPNAWLGAFQMSDRFGSYGLIGMLICREAGAHAWEIDTWLMSCRTLGRQMEKFMFDRLLDAAREREVRTLIGIYRPTAKNKMVAGLYDQFGFRRVSETAEETRYELSVPLARGVTATQVRDVSRGVLEPA